MERHITVPVAKEEIQDLRAGDYVYLTGVIYTARDAAHKRMDEVLSEGKELPLDIKNQMIYYMGPSPAREGRPIGSAGPTTASRMDKYAPRLLDLGLGGMIGKGKRSQEKAVELQKLAEEKSLLFMVTYTYMGHVTAKYARDLIASGAIGVRNQELNHVDQLLQEFF